MGTKRRLALGTAVVGLLLTVGAGVVLYQNSYELREERVTIGALDGVLAMPTSGDSRPGLVIFVHGDGLADATHDGFYRPLWESFAAAGYASLSWNKPGVAGSTGNWLHQSMDDRATEVTDAITWARSRPDIDPRRIGLWGASQAGWVMPKVAARTPDLAFVIAVSPAVNWLRQGRYNLLTDLSAAKASPTTIADRIQRSEATRRLLRAGASYAQYQQEPAADPGITADRWAFISKNYLSDATADLRASRAPVLLLLAGHDRNVDVADTEATYRTTVPALEVRHYADATHAMIPTTLEDSTVKITLVGLFAPRSVFADGFLEDQQRYLRSRPTGL